MAKGSDAPLVITVAIELVEGGLAAFLPLITENAARSLADEPGCLRFDVLQPIAPEARAAVFLYEIYVNDAAFDEHLASPHYDAFNTASAALIRAKDVQRFRIA
jgi:(4S)-4-hydroxy-5-phosphonooxypentane-2,3-dione isomerase